MHFIQCISAGVLTLIEILQFQPISIKRFPHSQLWLSSSALSSVLVQVYTVFQPHTCTQIYLYLFIWIFSFIWAKVCILFVLLAEDLNSPDAFSESHLPSLHLTSLCALKITHTALATFNYICLFSCFAPSSNGTPRRLIFFGKIFHNIYACSLLKQIFKTSVSDSVEDHERGWRRWTPYN